MSGGNSTRWANDLGSNGPIGWTEVGNLFVIFLAGTLAAAAGVGGGAIYTPLYIVLFALVYEAVPLSKAAVFGAALVFFLMNIAEPVPYKLTKHPNRFAYDVIMVMEPATLLGTTFGVLASRTCPMWLITLMMTSLLAFSAFKTFSKAHSLFVKETKEREATNRRPNGSTEVERGLLSGQKEQAYGAATVSPGNDEIPVFQDGEWLGWRCLFTVGLCFLSVITAAILADNDVAEAYTAFQCNSFGFWMIILCNSLICAAITVWNVYYLTSNSQRIRRELTVDWTHGNGVRYASLCLVAGFLSALCGIGGSTIKGPIIYEMGVNPTLAKATAQLMLLSTVSSSAFQFFLSDELPPVFGTTFFLLGGLSALAGKYSVDKFVQYNGRQSTIIYLLGWYIVVATLTMTSIGVIIVLGQIEPPVDWNQLWFRSICDEMPPDLGALKWLASSEFVQVENP